MSHQRMSCPTCGASLEAEIDQKDVNCPWCGNHLQAAKERPGRDLPNEAVQSIGEGVSYMALRKLLEAQSTRHEELLTVRARLVEQMGDIVSPKSGNHLAEVILALVLVVIVISAINRDWGLFAGVLCAGLIVGSMVLALRRRHSGDLDEYRERLSDLDVELNALTGDMAKCKRELERLSQSMLP